MTADLQRRPGTGRRSRLAELAARGERERLERSAGETADPDVADVDSRAAIEQLHAEPDDDQPWRRA